MNKFHTPTSITNAIKLLGLPSDVHEWFKQTACLDPVFPRRFIEGELCVVPDQAAEYLLSRELGHLLTEGPYAEWVVDEEEENVDDEDADEANEDNQEDDEALEDDRPIRRSRRKNR